jgi:lipoprotein-anchoring transpeptidase ErfK/SrfK
VSLRAKPFIIVAGIVAALAVLAGGAYAYDQSQADRIGKGVRVGGIDLEGLTRQQAHAKLERLIVDPLRRPIVVHHKHSAWRLGPEKANIGVDVDAMVDEAMARTRSGDLLGRVVRELTGKSLNADIEPTVTYSHKAVKRLVRRVQKGVDRPPRNASAKVSLAGVTRVPSREGLAVRTKKLRRKIRRAILSPTADRTLVVRPRHLKPEVTNKELAKEYGTVIVVNRGAFRLSLYKHFKPVRSFTIAVGQVGLETPAGLYHIQNKAVNPAWSVPNSAWAGSLAGQVIPGGAPNNPLKARWMGIFDGAGIHGTDALSSLGTAASHGCIRMAIPDVIELYNETPVGAPVYIA